MFDVEMPELIVILIIALLVFGSGRLPEIGTSRGLATFPEDTMSIEDLIRNADTALYAAKAQGKNRVVVYQKTDR